MRILAICGSLRARSSNGALLDAAAQLAPAGVYVERFGGIGELPHFNPDVDVEPPPPAVARWRDALRDADAILLSSPEYVHGVPGALKNALDWIVSSGEFAGKPLALIDTSRSTFATPQLREILGTMEARDRWRELRPQLEALEKRVVGAGKRAGNAIAKEIALLAETIRELRDGVDHADD